MASRINATQAKDVAISLQGEAYELAENLKGRYIPLILQANAPSSTYWQNALNNVREPEFILPANSQGASSNVQQQAYFNVRPMDYLMVGVVPHRLQWGGTLILPAATPILHEDPRDEPVLYVLLDVNQHRKAFPVDRDEIFYFSEYRTDAETFEDRQVQWLRKVKEAAVRPPGGQQQPQGPPIFNALEELKDLLKERSQLSPNDLNRLRYLTDELLNPSHVQRSTMALMEQFMNPTSQTEFTLEIAEQLATGIKTMWPEIQRHGITADKLVRLRRGIVDSKSTVGWSRVFGFLALGCEASLFSPNLGESVIGFLDTIDKIQGLSPVKTPSHFPQLDDLSWQLGGAMAIARNAQHEIAKAAQTCERRYRSLGELPRDMNEQDLHRMFLDAFSKSAFDAQELHRYTEGSIGLVLQMLQTVRTALSL